MKKTKKNIHSVDGTKRVGTDVKIKKAAKNNYNSVVGKNTHSIKKGKS